MDTATLPFALDYGLQNGPILLAKDMDNKDFIDQITGVDLNYDYSAVPVKYETTSFWESIADNTTGVVNDASGFVWDTATGTWDTLKSGAASVANAVSDAGSHIAEGVGGVFDSILMRILLVFAVLMAGVWILGKSGVLKDVSSILGNVL